jgi:hypothetical protein
MPLRCQRCLSIAVLLVAGAAFGLQVGASRASTPPSSPAIAPLPPLLSGTGLYRAGSIEALAPGIETFSPQYPLWSDGAGKRRWIALPPGASIDGADPDAWEFPRGTRLWKEFAHGRRVETRFIERLADGSWRFSTYVWKQDGSDAELAPESGIAALPVADAPGGRYAIPSRADCMACHGGANPPVLGFSALQLSPDRDALAPHAEALRPGDLDLPGLVAKAWLVNLPRALLAQPPRIHAATPKARAVLGYLHGNCANCHRPPLAEGGAVPVDLSLLQTVGAPRGNAEAVLKELFAGTPRYRAAGLPAEARLLAPGNATQSVLPLRMRSRNPYVRMPPLGTRAVDTEALALIDDWIDHELVQTKEEEP